MNPDFELIRRALQDGDPLSKREWAPVRAAAHQGDREALILLGQQARKHDDLEKARYWFHRAGASDILAEMDREARQHRDQLLRAAQADDLEALVELAMLQATGRDGLEQDQHSSRRWHLRAAELGSGGAAYHYALMCLLGEAGAEDRPEALRWLQIAAESEHGYTSDAQRALSDF